MAKQKLKTVKPDVSVKEVLAQRGPKYGPFIDQASVSQSLKHVMFATPNWSKLAGNTPTMVRATPSTCRVRPSTGCPP